MKTAPEIRSEMAEPMKTATRAAEPVEIIKTKTRTMKGPAEVPEAEVTAAETTAEAEGLPGRIPEETAAEAGMAEPEAAEAEELPVPETEEQAARIAAKIAVPGRTEVLEADRTEVRTAPLRWRSRAPEMIRACN